MREPTLKDEMDQTLNEMVEMAHGVVKVEVQRERDRVVEYLRTRAKIYRGLVESGKWDFQHYNSEQEIRRFADECEQIAKLIEVGHHV